MCCSIARKANKFYQEKGRGKKYLNFVCGMASLRSVSDTQAMENEGLKAAAEDCWLELNFSVFGILCLRQNQTLFDPEGEWRAQNFSNSKNFISSLCRDSDLVLGHYALHVCDEMWISSYQSVLLLLYNSGCPDSVPKDRGPACTFFSSCTKPFHVESLFSTQIFSQIHTLNFKKANAYSKLTLFHCKLGVLLFKNCPNPPHWIL